MTNGPSAPVRAAAPAATTTTTYEEILATVRCLLADLLKAERDEIVPTSTPIDLGADSICLTRLGFQLERALGVKVPREYTIPDEFTIDALARRLASDVAARTT